MPQLASQPSLFSKLRHPCRCGWGKIPKAGNDYYRGHRAANKTGFHICKDCEKEKPEEEFYVVPQAGGEKLTRYWRCKECVSTQHKRKRKTWTAEQKAQNQRHQLKWRLSKRGLSIEDFEKLLTEQKGKCAICCGDNDGIPLNADHCHKTGIQRGLLCDKCNWGLGHFQDEISRLLAAVEYLKKWTPTSL